MNTFTIDELDREEIEFLPPRVVMTACNTRCHPCWQPCAPKVQVCATVKLGCFVRCDVNGNV